MFFIEQILTSALGISENKVKHETRKVLEATKGSLKDYVEYPVLIIMILASLNIF